MGDAATKADPSASSGIRLTSPDKSGPSETQVATARASPSLSLTSVGKALIAGGVAGGVCVSPSILIGPLLAMVAG